MLLHLITMCVGLIIAFGLQQLLESFQRRRRFRQARAESLQPAQPTPGKTSSSTSPQSPSVRQNEDACQ